MVLTHNINSQSRRELIQYTILVFAVTWGIASILIIFPEAVEAVFGEMSTLSPVYFLAVYAPLMTAVGLTIAHNGRAEVLSLFLKLKPRLPSLPYYALVILGWPIVDSIALFCQHVITGESVEYLDLNLWYLGPTILVTTLLVDAGPMGEELGWRGYALPRLLTLFGSPLKAALLLGVVWGIWHLPAFFISGTAQHDLGMGIFWLILGTTLVSIIMTWLYQRTGGDVLAAGLLVHLMNNLTQARLPFVDLVYLPIAFACAVSLWRYSTPIDDNKSFFRDN